VIAAGVGDDATASIFFGKGRDLVVCTPELERTDSLMVFRLEVELASVFALGVEAIGLVNVLGDQLGAHGDAAQARLRFANIVESDDGRISVVIPG
jgi:hypothetical protein